MDLSDEKIIKLSRDKLRSIIARDLVASSLHWIGTHFIVSLLFSAVYIEVAVRLLQPQTAFLALLIYGIVVIVTLFISMFYEHLR